MPLRLEYAIMLCASLRSPSACSSLPTYTHTHAHIQLTCPRAEMYVPIYEKGLAKGNAGTKQRHACALDYVAGLATQFCQNCPLLIPPQYARSRDFLSCNSIVHIPGGGLVLI